MNKPFSLFLTLLLALALGACGLLPQSGGQSAALAGTSWQAISIGDLVLSPEIRSTIYFEKDEVNGNAGCNSYFGAYTQQGQKLTFSELGSTMMFCMEGMEQETAFHAALATVTQYRLENGLLTLLDDQGETLVVLSPIQHAILSGPVWQANVVNNGQQAVSSLPEGVQITAQFQDGKIQGSAGCNNYFGAYQLEEDGQLTIQDLGSTEMFCNEPAGVMDQESAFLQALSQAASYQIREQSLTILDANGAALVVFQTVK